jgi:integrase/recombinase XerD
MAISIPIHHSATELRLTGLLAIIAALRAINAPRTVFCRVQELRLALSAMEPERDWSWIRQVESRIRRTITPARNRRAGLPSSARLYDLGLTLMKEAERPSTSMPVMQAVQYRDGLMISFLAARPLRRHNFAAIEIGRHLVKQGEQYWIRFEAAETKTHAPIEAPFPAALVPYLERYLWHYRPLLTECDGYWRRNRIVPRRRPSGYPSTARQWPRLQSQAASRS